MRYFPFLFAENKNLYSLWKSVSGLFLKPSSGILGAPPYAAIKNNAVTKGEMKHEHSIDPVSYTHLDVYKRQVCHLHQFIRIHHIEIIIFWVMDFYFCFVIDIHNPVTCLLYTSRCV